MVPLGLRVLIRGGNEEKNLFLGETFRECNHLGASKMFGDLAEFLTSVTTPTGNSKFTALSSNQWRTHWRVFIRCRILNQSELIYMLQIKCESDAWLNRSGLRKKKKHINMSWVFEAYPFFCMPSRDRITNVLMRIRFKSSGHFEMFRRKHVSFLCQK